MPAKGKSRVTAHQKAAVAIGKASGKTIPEIAKAVGIAPSTVSHLSASPQAKGIIDRIITDNPGMLTGLMQSVVKSLEHDIAPGSKLNPEQRERARAQAVTVLQLGQPKVPETTSAGPGALPGGGVFLGDMLSIYRSAVIGATAAPEQP
jgi:hypothetical protein